MSKDFPCSVPSAEGEVPFPPGQSWQKWQSFRVHDGLQPWIVLWYDRSSLFGQAARGSVLRGEKMAAWQSCGKHSHQKSDDFISLFYTIYFILLIYILHSSERSWLSPLWAISSFWWVSESCVVWTSAVCGLQIPNGIGWKWGNALTTRVMIRWKLEIGTAVALAFYNVLIFSNHKLKSVFSSPIIKKSLSLWKYIWLWNLHDIKFCILLLFIRYSHLIYALFRTVF